MSSIKVRSTKREEMIDITGDIGAYCRKRSVEGAIILFVCHTTCGLTINENADPDVKSDMLGLLARLIPQNDPHFRHFEGNSDAHIKSSLVGCSLTIPCENGQLLLGRWQGIYLCEFDGPRERSVLIKVIAGPRE